MDALDRLRPAGVIQDWARRRTESLKVIDRET